MAGMPTNGSVSPLRISRRSRRILNVGLSIGPVAVLTYLLVPRAGEVADAVGHVSVPAFVLVCALSLATQLCRSEVWQVALRAAGGTMPRRLTHAASAFLFLGSIVSVHAGHVARVAILRRSARDDTPPLASMVAAEAPAYVAEGIPTLLMGLLVARWLHLPTVIVALMLVGLGVAMVVMHHLYRRAPAHRLARGIAALMHRHHGWRIAAATAGLIAAQLARTAIVLAALGIDPSPRNTMVVYLAGGIANALPFGGAVGTAAALTTVAGAPVALGAAVGLLLSAGSILSALAYSLWGAAVLFVHHARERTAPDVALGQMADVIPLVQVAGGEPLRRAA
jgi:hypothetical protein